MWDLRKKGVGLLGNRSGDRRPIPFVEDTAVPPHLLADYIKDFKEILDSYDLAYGMFGHVDVGCLHVRPALNLRSTEDEALFREISDKVKNLVKKYQGIMWAEHGRGFRSEYTEEFFGKSLFQDLRKIKNAFDPRNQLNPGKLVTPLGHDSTIPKIDEIPLRGHQDKAINETSKSFQGAVNCNGNGACFHFDPNHVMCPSYKATGMRVHSPKGRASLMREWLKELGQKNVDLKKVTNRKGWRIPYKNNDFSHEVYDGMAGCLSCKACVTQCPVKVDIPELKSRFLEAYHSRYLRPMLDYFVAYGEKLHFKLAPYAKWHNFLLKQRFVRYILDKSIGLKDPPLLSEPGLVQSLDEESFEILEEGKEWSPIKENTVILVQDAFTSFFEAPLVLTTMKLLKKLGFDPRIASFKENGKGQHVKGFRAKFFETARKNLNWLQALQQTKAPLIGIEPAVVLTYREEYPELIGETVEVKMIHEWLSENLEKISISKAAPKKYALFPHCQEQTSGIASLRNWQKIFEHFGHELTIENVGCCGMAGAYGHESKNYQTSKRIFDLSWGSLISRSHKDKNIPLATGSSCRSQTKRFGNEILKHPIEVL